MSTKTEKTEVSTTSKTETVKAQREITDRVLTKINELQELGELKLPSDYNAANALKSAMLVLQDIKTKDKRPVLQACSQNSIAQSLLKMVIEGLSVYKGQGYFIPYGTELTWSRSYQGARALAKRVAGVKDVVPGVVYENDVFEYEVDVNTGRKRIIKHQQSMENIDNAKIKGAYAVIIHPEYIDVEVMTIKEIEQSWKQGYGKGDVHQKFTQEMVKKTIISRACKPLINSSNDSYLDEDSDNEDINKAFASQQKDVNKEIGQEMAAEVVDFDEAEEVADEPTQQAEQIEAGF